MRACWPRPRRSAPTSRAPPYADPTDGRTAVLQASSPGSADRRGAGPSTRSLDGMTLLAVPADRRIGWGAVARRLDPILDPAIAVLAVVSALTSYLLTDVGAINCQAA